MMAEDFIALPRGAKNITGNRYGRLVALGPVNFIRPRGVFWLCQCDCGNTTVALSRNLGYGTTRSCGCLFMEGALTRFVKHGKSDTSLHNTWSNMIARCHAPANTNFHHYGGRGISVCAEWRQSFEDFEFYVAQLPHFGEDDYTLDRINNNGNYEPGNVRWATYGEQKRNTRRNRMITRNGKTQCLKDWCNELGIGMTTVLSRLNAGWSMEDSLTRPIFTKVWDARRNRET